MNWARILESILWPRPATPKPDATGISPLFLYNVTSCPRQYIKLAHHRHADPEEPPGTHRTNQAPGPWDRDRGVVARTPRVSDVGVSSSRRTQVVPRIPNPKFRPYDRPIKEVFFFFLPRFLSRVRMELPFPHWRMPPPPFPPNCRDGEKKI